ncbi:NUDIX domain-containing protein [Candidatus Nomurabacteria bacterium]|nr:NUDIX domain-containing protein [Candidatus Nomurabacteria bacterium]
MEKLPTNKIVEKITFRGKMIELVQKDMEAGGKTWTMEFARRSPGTRLIIERGDNIILTREFRHELGKYDFRLPGGKVFDTLEEYSAALGSNVDIAEAAKIGAIKEAREEAGVDAKNISFLHKSENGATMVWDLYYYAIRDFNQVPQDLEIGEDIKVEVVSKERAKEMCLSGEISEDRSALVLLRYLGGSLK